MRIHLVLVEPEIPQNTGNIARTCAAAGLYLHLVKPLGFSIDSKAVKRSGMDYWYSVPLQVHESLDHFLDSFRGASLFFLSAKAPLPYTEIPLEDGRDIYLLFGKETAGLPRELLSANRGACFRIPMREGTRSLNLSTSAAIVAYDLLRRRGFPGLAAPAETQEKESFL